MDRKGSDAEKYVTDPMVSAYNIPYTAGDFDNGKAKKLVEALKTAGLLEKAYYYIGEIDEPSPALYPKVREY